MLVSIEDLSKTSLYAEIIQEITRGDNEAAELQILAAESLVRSYMSRYDNDSIFGTMESAPTYTGADVELIKKVVKIITSYYLVRMNNPDINIELFRADYEDAIKWLKDLQEGNVNPSLPYKPENPNADDVKGGVWWGSLPKQDNFF